MSGKCGKALTDDDKAVRKWFVSEMKVLGCKVLVDEMGSIFAIRPGENNELPSIAIGSHLDTPLEDGRYSGITGVMAGVEIMRTLAENKVTTYAPIAVVNWTNGGGGRFPKAIVASGVWSGDIRLADAHNLQTHSDVPEETTMRSELERIGFKGDLSASHEANPLLAHFELYVDQHSVLQDQSIDVGIVTGGQAMLWYDVQIFGPAHISMNHEDPVRMQAQTRRIGSLHPFRTPNDRGNDTNTKLLIICSHLSEEKLGSYIEDFFFTVEQLSQPRFEYRYHEKWRSSQIQFHKDIIKSLKESTNAQGLSSLDMRPDDVIVSYYTSQRVPTGMVYIPYSEGKDPSSKALADGLQTLIGAMLRYDDLVRSRAD
ncbi:hypothetical protein TRICI_005243 [Trichomonascus ciferrii]|uniref:Peptidase M20 dimerisation domain-containing protein n=1 Tax=Trichomonascus ciferrii TaxID=44093 RepID=A0A642UUL2_9ASCO|nr:hypothetical protein TRICI_005243 [Trichomonascus ciferrii]